MFSYTRTNVNVITFIITIIICSCINYVSLCFDANKINDITKENTPKINNIENKKNNTITKNNIVKNTTSKNVTTKNNTTTQKNKTTNSKVNKLSSTTIQNKWKIEIPIIGLVAPIAEGTTTQIMDKYVGHFEVTSLWTGNVGLAAHNRRISCKLFF